MFSVAGIRRGEPTSGKGMGIYPMWFTNTTLKGSLWCKAGVAPGVFPGIFLGILPGGHDLTHLWLLGSHQDETWAAVESVVHVISADVAQYLADSVRCTGIQIAGADILRTMPFTFSLMTASPSSTNCLYRLSTHALTYVRNAEYCTDVYGITP